MSKHKGKKKTTKFKKILLDSLVAILTSVISSLIVYYLTR